MAIRNVLDQKYIRRILSSLIMVFMFNLLVPASFAAPIQTEPTPTQKLQLGERIYREGILPSGEPLQAVVKGDIPVPGTSFSCISCHMRSGLGSTEGGVVTTPTNGKSLFEPRNPASQTRLVMNSMGGSPNLNPATPPPGRPAYTEESLAAALRGGVDPSGRPLDSAMPRYDLNDRDMTLLVSYLMSLSSDYSPGVDGTTLHFATVITEDVNPAEYESMPVLLENYLRMTNEQAQTSAKRTAKPRMLEYMLASKKVAYRNLSLSRWVLKGPPETWRDQLEEYYHNEPVFALIGGISTKEWKPVHDFCESRQIPALFPQTDYPVISENSWYTLYFSKGFYQEGAAAARYLNGRHDVLKGKTVVQIVRDSRQGHALSEGFQSAWHESGQKPLMTITQKAGAALSTDVLKQLLSKEKPAFLIIWDDAGVLPALESIVTGKDRPEMIFMSSSYIGAKFQTISDRIRDITYLTYPYRLPQDDKRFDNDLAPLIKGSNIEREALINAKQTYATIRILSQALMDMKENFYRDYFLDLISMNRDVEFPLYERLSFGPGQRYASKGCYIVQLEKGPGAHLIKKTDWVAF